MSRKVHLLVKPMNLHFRYRSAVNSCGDLVGMGPLRESTSLSGSAPGVTSANNRQYVLFRFNSDISG